MAVSNERLASLTQRFAGKRNEDILAALQAQGAGRINVEEATALLASRTKGPGELQVDRNKSGGIFVRHPRLQAYSFAKNKSYTPTINFSPGVAESMFGKPDVLKEITEAVVKFLIAEQAAGGPPAPTEPETAAA